MNRYRVKTYGLEYFDYGEIITKGTNGEAIGEKHGSMYSWKVIERNPKWFEKIEEPEFEEGKYYYFEGQLFDYIIRCNGGYDKKRVYGQHYPINTDMGCYNETLGGHIAQYKREATDDEVEQALIKEAKGRGYPEADKWNPLWGTAQFWSPCMGVRKFKYSYKDDVLFYGNVAIYKEGQFAEIIEDEWEVELFRKYKEYDDYMVSNGDRHMEGYDSLSKEEAEAIAKALNEL